MKTTLLPSILIILTFGSVNLMAQSCLDNLEDASRAYYNGRFDEVISLLDCDLTTVEPQSRTDVLELLIKSNLLLNNDEKADQYMFDLLSGNPLYTPRSSDILLFQELFRSYELRNPWNFGVVAGINLPQFEIMRYQSIGSVTQEPESYTARVGLGLGLRGERAVMKNLYLNLGLLYQNFGYSYSEIILEYQQLDVQETFHTLDLPLSLRYELPLGSFKPFINAGASAQYILKSRLELDLRTIPTEVPVPYAGIPQKTNNYNATSQRKNIVFNYILGGGLRKSIGTIQLELAMSYQFGLNNLINSEARLSDPTLINTYAYIPDDLKLNNFMLTVGVYKSILTPKKR